MTPPFVTRFAPSPTGFAHLGHAFSAITAHNASRQAGGRFLLRIEDIDFSRCRAHFESALFDDLAWLGLEWEMPVRRQSDHMDDYAKALAILRDRGLIYRCFRTRAEVAARSASAPHGPISKQVSGRLAPDQEKTLIDQALPFAWRLDLAAALAAVRAPVDLTFDDGDAGTQHLNPTLIGDVVLGRKELGVAYHLAVVVDDAMQGITEVVRGLDLLEATHTQRLLQALLGLPTPRYHHHRLILGPDGKRLAKRNKAQSLRELRAVGARPEDIRRRLGLL